MKRKEKILKTVTNKLSMELFDKLYSELEPEDRLHILANSVEPYADAMMEAFQNSGNRINLIDYVNFKNEEV